MIWTQIPAALVALVWLLPNHHLPWHTAWQEAAALMLVLSAGLLLAWPPREKSTIPSWPLCGILLLASSMLLQQALQRQLFFGDTVLGLLYLGAACVALTVGTVCAKADGAGGTPGLTALALVTLGAAVVSVGIALSQWTQTYVVTLGLVTVDLPPGARPFANLGQANHFNSACFLGLCALWLLYEVRLVGRTGLWIGGLWLLIGMAASGSRTAWLQLTVVICLVVWCASRVQTRLQVRDAGVGAALFVLLSLAWPLVNDVLGVQGGRSVAEGLSSGGVRFKLWWTLLDAVSKEPWLGYGWLQTAMAQQSAAGSHPPVGYLFEQAHNLVLDLWIWCGVPLGTSVLLCFAAGLVIQLKALEDARAMCLMASVLGLLAHAMVEQPLHHSYFLLPFCLALGAMHTLCPKGPSLQLNSRFLAAVSATLTALLVLIAIDYLKAEESFRQLRMESARIGVQSSPSEPPNLRVLDQLEAFQWFARTEARPQMLASELQRMRAVSARYPQPPVLLRHALAEGLNGDPVAARHALALICKMHNAQRCLEGQESWRALQSRYPELKSIDAPA